MSECPFVGEATEHGGFRVCRECSNAICWNWREKHGPGGGGWFDCWRYQRAACEAAEGAVRELVAACELTNRVDRYVLTQRTVVATTAASMRDAALARAAALNLPPSPDPARILP